MFHLMILAIMIQIQKLQKSTENYLIIKETEKNLIGKNTSKMLAAIINSWDAFHYPYAVQIFRYSA